MDENEKRSEKHNKARTTIESGQAKAKEKRDAESRENRRE
jgi:hypothetical protein